MLFQTAKLRYIIRGFSITVSRTYSRHLNCKFTVQSFRTLSPATNFAHDLRVLGPESLPAHSANVLVQQTRSKKRKKPPPKQGRKGPEAVCILSMQ